jgi:tryptophan halogenase
MQESRTRYVIVGGGTAGWLAALMLRRHAALRELPIDIAVVESSRIPTIGVGEGTTGVFGQVLQWLGIEEPDFVRSTGATIKFGIRHKEWLRKGHSYDGPIDDPNLLAACPSFSQRERASALDIHAVSTGRELAEIHLFGELMKRGRSPYGLVDGEIVRAGPYLHAYHFDQAKVGAYLRGRAEGIERIDAEVTGLRRNAESGRIEALLLDESRETEGDFFVDCTGFRRKLICEGMGARWISYADTLPVNRAMPFWLDHEEGVEVAPYTLSWAQEAGWMWAIPTQDRIGCGYVYSDHFHTPETAREEIEKKLGRRIEPRNDLRFDSGRLDRAWVGNCLALGLSSSFLEPLEATSIHGTVVQLFLFCRHFMERAPCADDHARARYNAVAERQLDDFRDFINLHYTGERDEPFWRHVRAECLHETTRQRLAQWSSAMPRADDFTPLPDNLPHIGEQLYYPVLAGLGHLDRKVARADIAANPRLRAHARKTIDMHVKENKKAATRCLGHRQYLDLVADGAVSYSWH